jgi:class 3 adenylate cyclase
VVTNIRMPPTNLDEGIRAAEQLHVTGIALGYATIGRIGFDGRYDYGAVGSVLNLASRLCDAAEPGQIVVSRRVLAEIDEFVELSRSASSS